MNDYLVVLVAAESEAQARRIARRLSEQAGCVRQLRAHESMFLWQGAIQEEEEVLMLIKTRTETFDELMSAVKMTHSYDTPEIIGLPVAIGSRPYLKWVDDEVTG